MDQALQTKIASKVISRVGTLLGVAYMMSAIDRYNVSVAALTMNQDLALTASGFGLGVSAFFWGYVAFQIPGNLALQKLGARLWLGAIIVVWGAITSLMALVHDQASFVGARILLGVAEAGFLPGVLVVAALWTPESHRGRFVGVVSAWGVSATVIGPPIAATLMLLDGVLGVPGWRWLFLLEGLPAIVIGVLVWVILADRPAEAKWLSDEEKATLQARLVAEARGRSTAKFRFKDLVAPPVVMLTVIYFLVECGAFTLAFWLPLVFKGMGLSNVGASYASAVPGACGCIVMVLWARSSDLRHDRFWHLLLPIALSGMGFVVAGLLFHVPVVAFVGLCLALAGVVASHPVLWTLPPRIMPPASLAVGVAMINSIGTSAGIFAPQLVGVLKDATGDYRAPLLVMAVPLFLAAGLAASLRPRRPDAGEFDTSEDIGAPAAR